MVTDISTSSATLAVNDRDAYRFVGQFCREQEPDACDIDYEVRVILAIRWFLGNHGRWSKVYIRRIAAALSRRFELLLCMEMVDDTDDPETSLRWALKHRRPEAHDGTGTIRQAGKPIAKRPKPRKSVKNGELRRVIWYFAAKADAFSLWIAGYFLIASRIGWRPGEIVLMRREGNFLRAPAEKNTNGRGLSDACEVDISGYPDWLVAQIDR